MIDFTNLPKKNKSYGGANGKKICILYDDKRYMLKFPSAAKQNDRMHYSNSCICEHIGCRILESIGLNVQKTLLGYYRNGTKKIVVGCEDFATDGWTVQDFASIKNTIIDSERNGYGTELEDILDTIDKQMLCDPIELNNFFWETFIGDCLIGNMDRHNGNWGFLYNEETDEIKLAPLWDCGSSLYPQADKEVMEKVLTDEKELLSRIYTFPTSAIRMNNKKINYFNLISSNAYPECTKALLRIQKKIDLNKIENIINEIEILDDTEKDFYKYVIRKRKELLIDNAIKQIFDKEEVLLSVNEIDETIENFNNDILNDNNNIKDKSDENELVEN